jgi:glyoxylate reductase
VVRSGAWRGWGLDYMLGMELRGKQLGIVGYGRIGRAVAARAPAFGMSVAYYDRMGKVAPPDDNARSVTFDELLVSSDVVSIHTPLTPDTMHLFDRRALARMKRSAYLVNTARGPIVHEESLAWANNVVLAAHLGSATRETRTAMAELAARNLIAVLNGNPPITPVT